MPMSAPGKFKVVSNDIAYGGDGIGLHLTTAANDTMVGNAAGAALTSGSDNSLFGFEAGDGLTSGDQNTIIGSQTGRGLTTQDHNTIVGYNILSSAPDALIDGNVLLGSEILNNTIARPIDMIVIGRSSLNALTVVNYSLRNQIVIGHNSLKDLNPVSTIGNVAIGHNIEAATGVNRPTSTACVLIGHGAVQSGNVNNSIFIGSGVGNNAFGSYHTIVGNNAGQSMPAGSFGNIGIGESTLGWTIQFGAIPAENVAVGYRAIYRDGFHNINPLRNTAIGARAMETPGATGDVTDNVAVGYQALHVNGGIRTVAIGANAGLTNVGGQDNIFIGYGADGSAVGVSDEFVLTNATAGSANPYLSGSMSATDRRLKIGAALQLQRIAHAVSGNIGGNTIAACTAVSITLTCQSANIAKDGRVWIIKDETGTASPSTPITIDTQGTETIDGESDAQIVAPYGVARLYSDGSNLFSW